VSDARYLRVVTFRAAGPDSAVDAVLRGTIVPRLLDDAGAVDAWAGRRGATEGHRVIASTWTEPLDPGTSSEAASSQRPAPDIALLCGRDLVELGGADIVDVEELELAIHARFRRSEPARVLRVFHGTVRSGDLPDYIAEARTGMLADARVNEGLVSFVLGHAGGDEFVSVSTWTGWPAIEAATGGNTRQPFATRNTRRLEGFRIVHLELLPEAPVRRAAGSFATEATLEPAT
jgi:hypothetical protein